MSYLTVFEEKNQIHPFFLSYFTSLIFSIAVNCIIILSVAQAQNLRLFLILHFVLHPHIQYNSLLYYFYIQNVPGSGHVSLFPCFTYPNNCFLLHSLCLLATLMVPYLCSCFYAAEIQCQNSS